MIGWQKHIASLDDPIIKQVDMYHQLYGFDELTLGELISQSYDFSEQKYLKKNCKSHFGNAETSGEANKRNSCGF